jgi:7-carboxy-7-deazaguanine synthase
VSGEVDGILESDIQRRPVRAREPEVRNFRVKEIYYTLQGEGMNTGRPAVFCRFSGCNLWTGLEDDRADAICRFCDTRFVGMDGPGGGLFVSAQQLAGAIRRQWPPRIAEGCKPLVVFTGGEPLLQLTAEVVGKVHDQGFEVAIETNGTQLPPPGIDWICVSPKARAGLRLHYGNELKLVFPQNGGEPERYEHLDFEHFLLQPMDGPELERNTRLAVQYCLEHPRWRLGLQTHKLLGIP